MRELLFTFLNSIIGVDINYYIVPLALMTIVSFSQLVLLNKSNNTKSKSEENSDKDKSTELEPDNNSETEYEKKLKEYINNLDRETVYSDQRSKVIYNKIIAKIYGRQRQQHYKSNRLSKLLGKAIRLFSKKRYTYEGIKKKRKRSLFYYNLDDSYFYRFFFDRIVTPVRKSAKKLGKGEVQEDAVQVRRKVFGELFALGHELKSVEKVIRDKKGNKKKIKQNKWVKYRYIHMYRHLYLPYLKRIYDRVIAWPTERTNKYMKYLPKGSLFFQGINYSSREGAPFFFPNKLYNLSIKQNYPTRRLAERLKNANNTIELSIISKVMWGFLNKFGLNNPKLTSFGAKRWDHLKKEKVWMHTLHYLYTKNRIKVYKQLKVKQRSRTLAYPRNFMKGRKRKKIRTLAKFDRLFSNVLLNYYLSRYFNLHKTTLLKSMEMNYAKYPFYNSSIRYLSHDFSSIFKRFARRQKLTYMSSKNPLTGRKLFKGPSFFNEKSRAINKNRLLDKRMLNKLKRRRAAFFGNQTGFRREAAKIIRTWLSGSDKRELINKLREDYTISGKWARARLDISMAAYALLNPTHFEELFKKELYLIKQKKKKNKYYRFLIRDSFGIQRLGADFFYYLGYFNPIAIRSLPKNLQQYYSYYERSKEGYLGSKRISTSPNRRQKKSRFERAKKKTKKSKERTSKSMRALYNYKGFMLWNYVSLYNSIFKSQILTILSKVNNTNNKRTPFSVLYQSNTRIGSHLRTLYGYLFKTEQYRPYKNSISDIHKRNDKSYKLIQTPRKRYQGTAKYRRKILRNKKVKRHIYDVYQNFKRYLKLKVQGNLPKGVRNLNDWYLYTEKLSTSFRPGISTSSRFFYMPFNMRPFLIRYKFIKTRTRRGVRGFRYANSVTRSKTYFKYLASKYRVLHPKNRTIARNSRFATQPNQSRHSLLYNHYLLIKELLNKQVKHSSNSILYKYMCSFVKPATSYLFSLPTKLLILSNLKKVYYNSKDYLTPVFTHDSYISIVTDFLNYFSSNIVNFVGSELKSLLKPLLQLFTQIIIGISIHLFFTISALLYTFYTIPQVHNITVFIAHYLYSLIINRTTVQLYGKIITILHYVFFTLFFHSFIDIITLLKFMIQSLIPLGYNIVSYSLVMCNNLNNLLMSIIYFFLKYTGLSSLFPKEYLLLICNLFVKITKHIITFITNLQFNKYIIDSYDYIFFKTTYAKWVEYRLMAFVYILASRFRVKGYRYYFLMALFSFIERDKSDEPEIGELMIDVSDFFIGYFARVYHWMIRPNLLVERFIEICYNFIWSSFFGDWAISGYLNHFRSFYLYKLDEAVVTALTYILVSPLLAVNLFFEIKPWTFRFFYREIILNFFLVTGYLIGVPVYYIYELVWRSKIIKIDQALVSLILYTYNLCIFLFIYSHQFLRTFYLMFPSFKVVLYQFLMSFEPTRLMRGLDYTINFHEELMTFYMAVLYSLFGLVYTYFFFARIPLFFFTLYRAIKINIQLTSLPFVSGDPNIDLKIKSIFKDLIEMRYLKFMYSNLKKKRLFYFSNDRILWFMKKQPAYSKLYYSFLFHTFKNKNLVLHIRKHSNTLYLWKDKQGVSKLKNKWSLKTYPFDKNYNWWELHEEFKRKYGRTAVDYRKYFDNLDTLQEVYPKKRPHLRSREGYILRVTESKQKRGEESSYWRPLSKLLGLNKKKDEHLHKKAFENRLMKKLSSVFKYYLQKPFSLVNTNLYELACRYSIIYNISYYVTLWVNNFIQILLFIYLFNLFLISTIISFIVYLIFPPFVLEHFSTKFVGILSFKHWLNIKTDNYTKDLRILFNDIQNRSNNIVLSMLLYIVALPWKLLRIFFYLSNIVFILYLDYNDLWDYIKKTAKPYMHNHMKGESIMIQRLFRPSISLRVSHGMTLYIIHVLDIVYQIIVYRLSKTGIHPLHKEYKARSFELTQKNIFNFSKRPSNLGSLMPYLENDLKKQDYIEGNSKQDYIRLDDLKDQ